MKSSGFFIYDLQMGDGNAQCSKDRKRVQLHNSPEILPSTTYTLVIYFFLKALILHLPKIAPFSELCAWRVFIERREERGEVLMAITFLLLSSLDCN